MTGNNPYSWNGQWYFADETGYQYGPFKTQRKATKELLKYCRWLDNGPTLWSRIKKWFKP